LSPEYRQRMLVSGMVQGVGFRFFTCRTAEKYMLTGYVKNLNDGDVEVVAEGKKEDVESFMNEIARGPSYSRIIEVKSFIESPTGQYGAFGIRY
jgi:acylphosphatase